MYDFVTHTWNVVKGKCSHDCSYCYMKRWGELKPVRFDEKELKTDLGSDKFIFIGSSTDMFASDIPDEWIQKTIDYCESFDNQYLLQTKYPERFHKFKFSKKFVLGTTIETNRTYEEMGNTPLPLERAYAIGALKNNRTFVTVDIGADSSNSGMPEPSREKIDNLISSFSGEVVIKKNLKRI